MFLFVHFLISFCSTYLLSFIGLNPGDVMGIPIFVFIAARSKMTIHIDLDTMSKDSASPADEELEEEVSPAATVFNDPSSYSLAS